MCSSVLPSCLEWVSHLTSEIIGPNRGRWVRASEGTGPFTGRTCKSPEPPWAVWFVVSFCFVSQFQSRVFPLEGPFQKKQRQQARLPFSPFAPAGMTEGLKQQDWRKMSYVLASTPASTQEQKPHWSAKRVSGLPAFGTLSPTAPSSSSPFPGEEFQPN